MKLKGAAIYMHMYASEMMHVHFLLVVLNIHQLLM